MTGRWWLVSFAEAILTVSGLALRAQILACFNQMAAELDPGTNLPEAQFIDFKCPFCGHVLSFNQERCGLAEECVSCLEVVIVPAVGDDTGRKLPLPIQTARLTLRRFHPADWKDLLELHSDEELMRFLEWGLFGEDEITRWLDDDARRKITQPGQSLWLGIALRDGGKLIGQAAVSYYDADRRQGGLVICVNRQFHRKGYATEAVRALLAFGFAGLGLHRVVASCDSRNEPARRLLEKAGLRFEGEFAADRFSKGEWVSTAWFAMLESEHLPASQ